jgi:F-type H+-transporting ATPase subunit epsilon
MAKLTFEVIQPTQSKVQGNYDHIIIPGIDGDFGVSENHTPFITKIRPGIMQLFKGTKIDKYAIHDGFVTVDENKITVVCDLIEHEEEIDKKRAASSQERAEKRLKTTNEEIDFRRAELALKKSLVRLDLGK